MDKEFQEMLYSYDIAIKPTTVRKPQAIAMIERVHLSMGDNFRTIIFEG